MASIAQRKLEKEVALQLIYHIGESEFLRMGKEEDDEPDVIVLVNEKLIGIEVATVYHKGHEKDVWLLRRGQKKPEDLEPFTIIEPDTQIRERIQDEINEKCLHSYAGVEETWLCINIDMSTVTAAQDIHRSLESYRIPKTNNFSRFYIAMLQTLSEGGGWVVYRIH